MVRIDGPFSARISVGELRDRSAKQLQGNSSVYLYDSVPAYRLTRNWLTISNIMAFKGVR